MTDDTRDVSEARARTEVAGYRIVRTLGRGGMAVVYLAEHDWLQRKVALKVLAPQLAEDERFRERFVRESRLAASLDHPNVVPIYEAGASGGDLFIAMRYVEGTDLRTLLSETGALDAERAIAICRQVASALDAAHDQGLVHRDVKPGNVLVARSRGSEVEEHVYLSDFGLTKRAASDSGVTGTGQFVGTLNYAAPEQFYGGTADARTDVYSLGCVLFECLTGHPPFESDNDPGLMYAHLQEAPPAVTTDRPDLPPAIDGVVAKAMAKKREERQPTAGSFVQEAARALDIGVPSGTDGSGGTGSRLPWLVAVAAVVVALIAIVVVSLLQEDTPSHVDAGVATSPPTTPSPTVAPAFKAVNRALDQDEERLLASVPPDLSEDCRPLDRPAPIQGELAALVCRTPDVEVLYELFPTQDTMDAAFRTNVNNRAASEGECATDRLAVSGYSIGGEPSGQVLCYTIGGGFARDSVGEPSRSHIEWTDENSLIYAHAVRNDLGDLSLYEWWLTSSGPVPAGSSLSEVAKDRPARSSISGPPDGSYLAATGPCASDRKGTCIMRIERSTYDIRNVGGTPFAEGEVLLRKPASVVFVPQSGFCFDQERSTRPVTYTWTEVGDEISFARTGGGICGGPGFTDPWTRAPGGLIALQQDGDIQIIGGGGAHIHTPTVEAPTNPNIAPDWSPDGSEIVFAGAGEQGLDIYVIGADGSRLRSITSSTGDQETPAWSPDGTRIAYAVEGGGESSSESGLFIIDADGQDPTELVARQDATVWDPSWSPDGRELVYTIFFNGERMYVLDAASGRSGRLAGPDGIALAWLPDGRIVFKAGHVLMTMRPDGSAQRVLLDDLPADIYKPFVDLSPDGRWILLSNWWVNPVPNAWGVYLISVDDGTIFQIANGTEANWRPASDR